MDLELFKQTIWNFYRENRRDFPWRKDPTPYQVVVSEIMLQQTQTDRVIPKYNAFIAELPDFATLAQASSRQVLSLWQGLGYNRRGLALHRIAQEISRHYNGLTPSEPHLLEKFKGIGPATAASICAFAYNKPTIFIETNIRAVFIHCFFPEKELVNDKELFPLIRDTIDTRSPKEWYYALMDYGVMLKKKFKNPSQKSTHHTKQSRFEGSERQVRGIILKLLVEHMRLTQEELIEYSARQPEKVIKSLNKLVKENLIKYTHDLYFL